MTSHEKSQKEADFIISGHPPICHKGGMAWQSICFEDVLNGCKTLKNALHHQVK